MFPLVSFIGVVSVPLLLFFPAQASSKSSADSLSRLYEFDDHPERKPFVDKLLAFMEERGSAITTCPTISKNPLDLYRLYIYTREKGGFMEVSIKWEHVLARCG